MAAASVGTIKFSVGNGVTGQNAHFIGGGGAAAGRSGNGATGSTSTGGVGVYPGDSGGNGGANGLSPGGGGGGGGIGVNTTGGNGMIILTYLIANQGSETNATTVQVTAGRAKLWSLDWNHAADGIAAGTRVSMAVRAIGV